MAVWLQQKDKVNKLVTFLIKSSKIAKFGELKVYLIRLTLNIWGILKKSRGEELLIIFD